MQYGDLSNKRGPAIVINADLLFNLKKKWLGLRYELKFMLSSRHLLEDWFNRGDLSIYIVCSGELLEYKEKIEGILDTFMAPYTDVVEIETAEELDYLVSAEHVIGYFYFNSTLVNERTDLRKHYQIMNIAEVSYLLDGGERNVRRN